MRNVLLSALVFLPALPSHAAPAPKARFQVIVIEELAFNSSGVVMTRAPDRHDSPRRDLHDFRVTVMAGHFLCILAHQYVVSTVDGKSAFSAYAAPGPPPSDPGLMTRAGGWLTVKPRLLPDRRIRLAFSVCEYKTETTSVSAPTAKPPRRDYRKLLRATITARPGESVCLGSFALPTGDTRLYFATVTVLPRKDNPP